MNKLRLLSEKSESDFSERTSAASRLASLFVVGRGLGHSSFILYGIGMVWYGMVWYGIAGYPLLAASALLLSSLVD